jgi:hypothetical protein
MSTAQNLIGEHDEVVLLRPVGRWPAGTRGTVLSNHPDYKIVEMPGIEEAVDDEDLDYMPEVATEKLRLAPERLPVDR